MRSNLSFPARHPRAGFGLALIALFLVLTACQERPAPEAEPASITEAAPQNDTANGLISRTAFFGEPVQFQGRISPDGAKVSWLALRDGALNLFVADAGSPKTARQYTFGKDGVDIHRWTPNSAYILYARSIADTNTSRVYALNVHTGAVRDLVPVSDGETVKLVDVSKNRPNAALVRLRPRGEKYYDLYQIDLDTGTRTLIALNPGFSHWVTDSDFVPRIGIKSHENGSQTWMLLQGGLAAIPLLTVAAKDTTRTRALQLDATATSLYMIDGSARPFAALTRIDLLTGEREVLAIGEDGDIDDVLFHPITEEPLAYLINAARPHWQALSPGFQAVIQRMEKALGPRFFILAATNTTDQIVVYSDRPEHPGIYSLYDLEKDRITTLFETTPALAKRDLVRTSVMRIKAKDGFNIIAYFTKAGVENPKDAPLIVIPQSGVRSRISYGFNPKTQWLSNRGYNVLEVNVRGAAGLGSDYARAGTGKGIVLGKSDLRDAIAAILDMGLANESRIAGFGRWFGGRTILDFASTENTPLKCVVALDPVLDLAKLLERAAREGKAQWLYRWLGNAIDMPDAKSIHGLSPSARASQNHVRTLLLQSSSNAWLDPQVSRQYVIDARRAGGDAALIHFIEIDDKAFADTKFIPFAALTENFLQACLGGKAEPLGDVLENMTFEVNAGKSGIVGLNLH